MEVFFFLSYTHFFKGFGLQMVGASMDFISMSDLLDSPEFSLHLLYTCRGQP